MLALNQHTIIKTDRFIVIAFTLFGLFLAVSGGLMFQINDLNSTLNVEKQETLVQSGSITQSAGNFSTLISPRSFQYSGYLMVYGTSTTDNAWVRLDYWVDGKLYSSTQTLGTQGELFFALPKTDSAAVYVGNLNPTDEATTTLTIIYHY
jgi:hypothetical protein